MGMPFSRTQALSRLSPRVGALVAYAGLCVAVLVPSAGGQTAAEDQALALSGRCSSTTDSGQGPINAIGLAGFGIRARVTMPEQVPLGAPAAVDVELFYELPESLASTAGQFDIETVDLSGTTFPITLHTPSGPLEATATPPSTIVDAATAAKVDLGAVHFDVPTDAPGALQVIIDPATVSFSAAPAEFAGSGTCTAGPGLDLPIGFIVDPLAPVVDPALRTVSVKTPGGSADVADDVTAGPGPVLPDSWRMVRNTGSGTATIDNAGDIAFNLTGAGMEAVWEVCGLSGPSAITSTTTADEPTRHCAQGVLRVRDGNEPKAEVLSSSTQLTPDPPTAGPPTGAPPPGPVTDAAPISVTG